MEQQFILRWVCLQGHLNYLNWTKCPILRELPAWKGSQTVEQGARIKVNSGYDGSLRVEGSILIAVVRKSILQKADRASASGDRGDEWDKGILTAGTECPKVPKCRDTEQHNIRVVHYKRAGSKNVRQGVLADEMVQGQRAPSGGTRSSEEPITL